MNDYSEYHERDWDFPEEMERKRNPLGTKMHILTAEDNEEDFNETQTKTIT